MSDKRQQKKRKRLAAAYVKPSICPHCGKDGKHFMPPGFGDPGYYICSGKLEKVK